MAFLILFTKKHWVQSSCGGVISALFISMAVKHMFIVEMLTQWEPQNKFFFVYHPQTFLLLHYFLQIKVWERKYGWKSGVANAEASRL